MSSCERLFSIDLRSLAIFRIALALVVIIDLCGRWPLVDSFLTDSGVLPRALHQEIYDSSHWSLYHLDGSLGFARVLMVGELLAALALLVGFYPRLASFICLVLVWSIQVRNPLINTGGDVLLRSLLAWMCLLPASTYLGVMPQAGRDRAESSRLLSIASAGIIVQLAAMYFFAGVAKLNDFWLSGAAIDYSLRLELYIKPFGYWLQEFPTQMRLATWGTLVLELATPLFLFSPWKTNTMRMTCMVLFWLMHIAIWMMFSIGIFSLAAMAAWIVLLPSALWERHATKHTVPRRSGYVGSGRHVNLIAGMFLAFVLTINIANIWPPKSRGQLHDLLHWLGRWMMVVQEFTMFGEMPRYSVSFVYLAELADGAKTDLFTGNAPIENPSPRETYLWARQQPWRRYHSNLFFPPTQTVTEAAHEAVKKVRERMLIFQIEQWNKNHSPREQVVSAELRCYARPIQFDRRVEPTTMEVWAAWNAVKPTSN